MYILYGLWLTGYGLGDAHTRDICDVADGVHVVASPREGVRLEPLAVLVLGFRGQRRARIR